MVGEHKNRKHSIQWIMLDSVCFNISITISLLLGKICYYCLQQLVMYSQADKQLELVILPQPLLSLSLSLTW